MEKLKDALKIRPDFEPGLAFDFEAQEKKRLSKLAEKDARRKDEKARRKKEKKEKQKRELQEQLAMIKSQAEEEEEEKDKDGSKENDDKKM